MASGFSVDNIEIDASQLTALLDSPDSAPLLLDVREVPELASGIIPGATSIPMSELERRVSEVPRERNIVCYCEHGVRSLHVAAWLQANGFIALSLIGGYAEWPGPRAAWECNP